MFVIKFKKIFHFSRRSFAFFSFSPSFLLDFIPDLSPFKTPFDKSLSVKWRVKFLVISLQMENIGWFSDFVTAYGVQAEYGFVTVDLYEKQNVHQVSNFKGGSSLFCWSEIKPTFIPTYHDWKRIERNKTHFKTLHCLHEAIKPGTAGCSNVV